MSDTPPIVVRDLVARHGHSIGHRRLVAGEAWARLQFRSDEDAAAFAGSLRWSAFEHQSVDVAALGADQSTAPAKVTEGALLADQVKQLQSQVTALTNQATSEQAAHKATADKLAAAQAALDKRDTDSAKPSRRR